MARSAPPTVVASLQTRRPAMFSVYCKHCGATLLLGPANILAVENTPDGIVVRFRCYRGHEGLWRNDNDHARRPLVRTGGTAGTGGTDTHEADSDLAAAPALGATRLTSAGRPRPARPAHADAQLRGRHVGADRLDSPAPGSSTRSGNERLDSPPSDGNAWAPEWARWSRAPWRRPRQTCSGTARRRQPPRFGS
jgi:hypothetical protein